MTGGNTIRAVGADDAALELSDADVIGEESATWDESDVEDGSSEDYESFEYQSGNNLTRHFPAALAFIAVAGWTGLFGWTHREAILAGAPIDQWIAWVPIWSMPVLLVIGLWLLVMRSTSRETHRFGAIAQTLAHETERLEQRMQVINRELSVAREFLAAESRDLEALGRTASSRLSEHAEHLQSLIANNSAQLDSIGSVSTVALENMERLRDDLPVIANSARDVSNQIGTAGRTAQGEVAELVKGLERLNQFGQASEKQVGTFQNRVDEALTHFLIRSGEVDETVATRFEGLKEKTDQFRADLDKREVEALAALKRRMGSLEEEFSAIQTKLTTESEASEIALQAQLASLSDTLGATSQSLRESEDEALDRWASRVEALKVQLSDALGEIARIDEQALASANQKLADLRSEAEAVDARLAERDAAVSEQIAARRQAIKADEESALAAFEAQLEALDDELSRRRAHHLEASEALASRSEDIAARLDGLESVIATLSRESTAAQTALNSQAETLSQQLANAREGVSETGLAVSELTEASVRLLELIRASVEHSQDDLPVAMSVAEERLQHLRENADGVRGILDDAARKGEDLSAYVMQTRENGQATAGEIDALIGQIGAMGDTHEARLAALRSEISAIEEQSALVSDQASERLRSAIASLEEAAGQASGLVEKEMAGSLATLADSIGSRSAESIENAVRQRLDTTLEELDETARRASATSQDTMVQLRDQLARVNELTANLENRIARAKEQAEEQVGHDFARRAALITEALNSSAIDIAKAIDSDVSDTSWASYLRGDRGIFTRRAVRLLDNVEARSISDIYEADDDFRANVSRYIADFEAMLRTMLSTRDGNALGVTLLSSDMGKLYVALAQSIERFRD